jgi:glutathione S-transferase/alpha,alpha-trehalase
MSGTSLDKASKALDTLENLLAKKEWLVDNKFSIADVAVGSYLNYVPVFFRSVNPVDRPNIVKYMERCAQRPAFAKAFGDDHTNLVLSKTKTWTSSQKTGNPFKFF